MPIFSCFHHPIPPKKPWFSDLMSFQKFNEKAGKCCRESRTETDSLDRTKCHCAPSLNWATWLLVDQVKGGATRDVKVALVYCILIFSLTMFSFQYLCILHFLNNWKTLLLSSTHSQTTVLLLSDKVDPPSCAREAWEKNEPWLWRKWWPLSFGRVERRSLRHYD